jgi:hypothetical protein
MYGVSIDSPDYGLQSALQSSSQSLLGHEIQYGEISDVSKQVCNGELTKDDVIVKQIILSFILLIV